MQEPALARIAMSELPFLNIFPKKIIMTNEASGKSGIRIAEQIVIASPAERGAAISEL